MDDRTMKQKECLFLASWLVLVSITLFSFATITIRELNNTGHVLSHPSICIASTLPGSSDPTGDEWPTFHGELNRTGVAKTTPANGTGPSWNYTTNGIITYSSPAVADGRVFVGSLDKNVYCINATTGIKIWNRTTTNLVYSSPAVAGGRVYVGSYDNNMYCLNETSGAVFWTVTQGGGLSSPAVAGGRLYVGKSFNINCLNATSGVLMWSNTTSNYVAYSSPAVAGGRVYVGSEDHVVYCLDAIKGTKLWTYPTGGSVDSSPAIAGGFVYIGSGDGKVYRLNATTGSLNWSFPTGSAVTSSPAVAGGRVFVGSYNHKVLCLNSTTGTSIWNYTTGNYVISSPAIAGGRVYIGGWDNSLYCLDAATGVKSWSYSIGSQVDSSPAIAKGHVYIGSYDHKIYSFPMVLIPSAPFNLQASGGVGQIMLSWQAPVSSGGTAITGYKIYVGTTPGGESLLDTIGNVLAYTASGLSNGLTYYFRVAAVNGNGEGASSIEVIATPLTVPSVPLSVTATPGAGFVLVNWTTPASNGGLPVTNYTVFRGITSGSEAFLLTLNNITTFQDAAPVFGQVNYYKISAVNAAGEGPLSAEASAMPISTVPGAPAIISVTPGNTQVVLSWAAPASNGGSAITNYKIYRGMSSGGETLVATVDNVNTWTDTGLVNGKVYYYKISAVNGNGEGAVSTEATAKTSQGSTSTPSTPGYMPGLIIGLLGFIVATVIYKQKKGQE